MSPQQDGAHSGKSQEQQPLTPSEGEAARLKALFDAVEPIEITGLDLTGKTPQEIARMLPRFTTLQLRRENPAFGILVAVETGRLFALRSGFSPDEEDILGGIRFRRGIMTAEVAARAGGPWEDLGAHLEGQAAALMRKENMGEAVLYMNAANPCKLHGLGCYFKLPQLLPEGAKLTVYSKSGRAFPFTGEPDPGRSP